MATHWVSAVEISKSELENRRCLNCHGQSRLATLSPTGRALMLSPTTRAVSQLAVRPEIYVREDALGSSVHAKQGCVSCHTGATTLPHVADLGKATCDTKCHAPAATDFLQGAHAAAVARGDINAPTCATCHGGHDILPKRDRRARTYPLNIVKICGNCHEKHLSAGDGDPTARVAQYLESVHGKALAKGGLAVAASCSDCHGSHRVLASSDPRSLVHRDRIPDTCGKCHVGLAETFSASVHGQELAKGNPNAPVCSDCHTAHAITRTDTPAFMLDIATECGTCHNKPANGSTGTASLYETYRRSYHGQVNSLGSTRAARCSDCHGAHDIHRVADANSRLQGAARVATCANAGKCHPDATPKFAQFQPHADFRDAARYPLLHGVWLYFVIMMSAAFGFFGLHSLLWFGRSLIERIKHGPRPHAKRTGTAIRRFNKVDRVNHAFVILSFFGLTLTGLPLLYSDQAWARNLAAMFGGGRACGIEHRIFAIMLIGNLAVHFVGLARRVKQYSFRKLVFGPATMLPRIKDFKDCAGMFRWFIRGGKKPSFDRWTYWEKFDYVAEVGGSMIIGLSGLMLWFPIFFSKFLAGWMFNIASVVHGYEALLAVGFIFTIHFFNAHLRMEKFPVDDVMFTGCLPEEEFKEERGDEYARLVKSGELESLRVAAPPGLYRRIALFSGILAMAIGTTIVVLIILAGLKLM